MRCRFLEILRNVHNLIDCDEITGQQRTVHVLHNSEQPASVFAILESGNKMVPLIADGLFDLLMLKMTSIYTNKKQTKIECKGPRFELGDFCIKLGSVTMTQNYKGVLVEVMYITSNFFFSKISRCFTYNRYEKKERIKS